LNFALVFEVDVVHYGVDALLFGIEDKATRVDKHDVGITSIVAKNNVVPTVDARGNVLAVNEVFATTERDNCKFLFVHSLF
jgi:hypothetical protein